MPVTRSVADAVCAEAVELARAAAVEVGGADVGEHVEVADEAERVATHFFACLLPGYAGWRWAVTVSRAPRARVATVDEVCLLPGEAAVLPKPWVPWEERIRPGDLGPGDVLPRREDDRRLVPAYGDVDAADRLWLEEIGYGRPRVLSREGRDDAAQRWYDGEAGPEAPIARQAPGPCATCGFYVTLAGALGTLFGACTNDVAPDDGRVVSADHGCGAHSEAVAAVPLLPKPPPIILDDFAVDALPVERDTTADAGTGPAGQPSGDA